MDRFHSIDVFLRITESGSFSKTSRDLGVTPQAISKRVRELEDWLGVRLLNRTTRRISLTDEGRLFRQQCSVGMAAIDDGVKSIQAASEEVTGNLRVAVRSGIGKTFVAPLIGKFLDQYPKVSIELLVVSQLPDVVEQRIDVGIAGGRLPDNTFVARKIADFRMVACAAPAYLARHGTPRSFEDLERHRCITVRNPDSGAVVPWIFRRRNEIFNVKLDACLITNDGEAELQAVLNGAGIGQIASYHVAPYLRSGVLKVVLPALVSKDYGLYVFMLQRLRIPKKNRAFADFMFDEIRRHPDLLPLP